MTPKAAAPTKAPTKAPTAKRPAAAAKTKTKSKTAGARAGGTSTLDAVGLLVHDVRNPFFADVARGVGDAMSSVGLSTILCNTDGVDETEAKHLQLLDDHAILGFAVAPVRASLRYLELLRERGLPVVLIDRPSGADNFCSVAVDNVKGGSFAGRHLLSLGHKQIAFIGPSHAVQQTIDRRQGLIDAMTDAGLAPAALTDIGLPALTPEAGEAAAKRLAAAKAKPTAAFCANDAVALGVLRGLAELGITVPDDIAVMGYDDVDYASSLWPPLTTVRQPKYGLGQAAARLLIDEIDHCAAHKHRQMVFAPGLVIRGSTAS